MNKFADKYADRLNTIPFFIRLPDWITGRLVEIRCDAKCGTENLGTSKWSDMKLKKKTAFIF